MAFTFRISTGVPTPIYRQIVDQVSMAVATRQIEPGERMPSVRGVAEELLVNPNTVARAYTDLVRAGVLETQPGKGIFVTERRQRYSDDEREFRLRRAVQQFVSDVALLGFERDDLLVRVDQELTKLTSGHAKKPVEKAATRNNDSKGGDDNE
jgi:GntR family transcriptional regulator